MKECYKCYVQSLLFFTQSQVFYHVVEKTDPNANIGAHEQSYIDRAEEDVAEWAGDTDFKASLVIVITWHNLVPYPSSTYEGQVTILISE